MLNNLKQINTFIKILAVLKLNLKFPYNNNNSSVYEKKKTS